MWLAFRLYTQDGKETDSTGCHTKGLCLSNKKNSVFFQKNPYINQGDLSRGLGSPPLPPTLLSFFFIFFIFKMSLSANTFHKTVCSSDDCLQVDTIRYEVYSRRLQSWMMPDKIARGPGFRPLLWCGTLQTIACIPFSWRNGNDVWDTMTNSAVLSPFWPVTPHKLEISFEGETLAFHSVAAAYTALKWWHMVDVRNALEKALTHEDIRREEEKGRRGGIGTPHALHSREASMGMALEARYSIPSEAAVLLSTSGAFLLCCHDGPVSQQYWSEGAGIGDNNLGFMLMNLRETLAQTKSQVTAWPAGVRQDDPMSALLHDLSHFCREEARKVQPLSPQAYAGVRSIE